jgi:hypothetical protein
MLALLPAAALPLCWRSSRAWPTVSARLRTAASVRLLRCSAPLPAPLPQSRPLWSVRERACSGGARRALSALGAAGACAAPPVACRTV